MRFVILIFSSIIRMRSAAVRWILAAMAMGLAVHAAFAQNITHYEEQGDLKRGSRSITALGDDFAGDKIDLYTGGVTVGQIDVSLPGNSTLPVAWGRRYNLSNHFGGWDIEVPRVSGTFAAGPSYLVNPTGWVTWDPTTKKYGTRRCTYFGAPGDVQDVNGGFWESGEFWSGHRIYVPGEVDEVLLQRDAANNRKPATGSYPIVTKSDWQVGCTTLALGTGEGFVALSPTGTKYVFDHMVSRAYGGISNGTGQLGRQEIWILVSQVTDRFGNWVKYTYDSTEPWKVTNILSSDGRELRFTYQTSGAYTVTAYSVTTTQQRTWSYSADGNIITQPDGRQWIYSLKKAPVYSSSQQAPHCSNGQWTVAPLVSSPQTSTVTHPSGAIAKFAMDWVRHGVTGILTQANPCPATGTLFFDGGPTPTYEAYTIKSKSVEWTNVFSRAWTFEWGPPNGSWDCGTSCIPYKQLAVHGPDEAVTRYTRRSQI